MLKRLRAIRFGVWITSIGLAIGVGIAFFLAALSTFTKAMAALFAASMSTLVLAVLFAERQSYAAALKDSRDQLQSALEHQRVLLAELDHRVKNVLATVSAVASQTKDASGSMDDFVIALDSRIRSMATAHELLSVLQWRGIPMAALVTGELAPFATRGNVEIDGPETMLLPSAGQAMAMVVHELSPTLQNTARFRRRPVRYRCGGREGPTRARASFLYGRKPEGQESRLQRDPAMASPSSAISSLMSSTVRSTFRSLPRVSNAG